MSERLKINEIFKRAATGEFLNISPFLIKKLEKNGTCSVKNVNIINDYVEKNSVNFLVGLRDWIEREFLLKPKRKSSKKQDINCIEELILDDELEIQYYRFRKKQYEDDFQFNTSSDQSILHQILMVEVGIFRKQLMQKEIMASNKKDSLKISSSLNKIINDDSKQLKSLIESLGADRKLRTGGKGAKNAMDISALSTRYESQKDDLLKEKVEEIKERNIKYKESQEARIKELKDLGISDMKSADYQGLMKKRK